MRIRLATIQEYIIIFIVDIRDKGGYILYGSPRYLTINFVFYKKRSCKILENSIDDEVFQCAFVVYFINLLFVNGFRFTYADLKRKFVYKVANESFTKYLFMFFFVVYS